MVEHGILASGERREVRQHGPGVDVSWRAAHQPVGLLYHGSHVQVVPVVEEILRGEESSVLLTDLLAFVLFSVLFFSTSKSCFWEQRSRGPRQQVT